MSDVQMALTRLGSTPNSFQDQRQVDRRDSRVGVWEDVRGPLDSISVSV